MPLIALLALALVMVQATADVLPESPLFWLVTPVRLVILVGLVALLSTWRPSRSTWWTWRRPFDLCVVALLAAAALPAHTFGAWAEWRGLLTGVAVAYLAAGVLRSDPESWRPTTLVAFVATATTALSGIRQTVQGIPTGRCRGALDGTEDSCGHADVLYRAIGTFGNPNLLAAFLLLMIPLAVAYAAAHTQRRTRAVSYLVVAAGVLGVVATMSRTGVIALVAMVGAYLVLRRPTTPRLVVAGVVTGAVLLGAITAVALGARLGVRTDVYEAAARLIREHPWGVGVGRTGAVLAATVPGDQQFQHAHNLWLDMLLAAGPLALAATMGITALVGIRVVRAARRGSAAGIALGSALAGFGTYCLLDNPINAIRNAYAAWVVVGLAVAVGHTVRHRRSLEVFREDGDVLLDPPGSRPATGVTAPEGGGPAEAGEHRRVHADGPAVHL